MDVRFVLSQEGEKWLRVCENRVLRRISGSKGSGERLEKTA
jgi:hypothetical protein